MAMGYGDGEALGKVRDGGIDGIINQDTLGVDKVCVQAKRFKEARVSAPMVQSFCGALDQKGVNKWNVIVKGKRKHISSCIC